MTQLQALSWPAKWQFAYGEPKLTATFKSQYRDFCVFENLGFTPSGHGEHVFLDITKTNTNTDYLARQIAQVAQVPRRQVTYSGMKDRHAITRQWFSVHLPGNTNKAPDWAKLNSSEIQLHQVLHHQKKLRLGVHQSNDFVITLRDLNSTEDIQQRLELIKQQGVPNYFGEQRFGRQGQNLVLAQAFCQGQRQIDRFKRGLAISSARAYLFNVLLSQQIVDGVWLSAESHNFYGFTDGYSQFAANIHDSTDLQQRLDDSLISPLGWLAGKAGNSSSSKPLKQEQSVLLDYQDWIDGLCVHNVLADRRSLRLLPLNFTWQWLPDAVLELRFRLLRGGYATSIIRELIRCSTI